MPASERVDSIAELAKKAKLASQELARASGADRQAALLAVAKSYRDNRRKILSENAKDVDKAKDLVRTGQLTTALLQRLKLDDSKLDGIITGIEQIAGMADPLGRVELARELDDGLELFRVTAPIGLIGVVFESRPDALPQIASLCIKSGNAVMLKGGSEAERSNRILFDLFKSAAVESGIADGVLQLLESRADFAELLQAEQYVDLIIPRGSSDLVRTIQNSTRIPVLGHAEGVCHIYIDKSADLNKAVKIVVDSKIQYPAACNAVETVLFNSSLSKEFVQTVVRELLAHSVEVRAEKSLLEELKSNPAAESNGQSSRSLLTEANPEDWTTEYGELIVSIKTVSSLAEAINHINRFGSHHTDCIVTETKSDAEIFSASVNSAGVFHNASTRFADGFRYGFGAEVGISTGKLHPRGPVGLEGLVTYKYKLIGDGHVVADYAGENAKAFTHKDLK